MITADGFDSCFIGTCLDAATGTVRAVYDAVRCVALLEEQGMTHEDAEEWFSFNVEGSYMGDSTPIFMSPMTLEEARSREL